MLFDGRGLARQRGLHRLQVNGFYQPHVGGHLVPRREEDEVAGDEFARRNPSLAPVADHGRRGRGHLAQGLDGALRAVLLHEAEDDREQHDHSDGNRLDPVTEEGRERRREEQDDDEYVLELFEQDRPRRDATGGLKLVRAEFIEAAGGLCSGQAAGRGLQPLETLFDRQRVPKRARLGVNVFSGQEHSTDMDVDSSSNFCSGRAVSPRAPLQRSTARAQPPPRKRCRAGGVESRVRPSCRRRWNRHPTLPPP